MSAGGGGAAGGAVAIGSLLLLCLMFGGIRCNTDDPNRYDTRIRFGKPGVGYVEGG